MDNLVADRESAQRLAKTIVSDIAFYHKEEVERGIVEDNLYDVLSNQIEEGRRHYESRVHPEFLRLGFYEKALVDLLLKPFGRIKSRIW